MLFKATSGYRRRPSDKPNASSNSLGCSLGPLVPRAHLHSVLHISPASITTVGKYGPTGRLHFCARAAAHERRNAFDKRFPSWSSNWTYICAQQEPTLSIGRIALPSVAVSTARLPTCSDREMQIQTYAL